jgi:hypothetical protein
MHVWTVIRRFGARGRRGQGPANNDQSARRAMPEMRLPGTLEFPKIARRPPESVSFLAGE